jgi:nucleotide-binding universal stress UspA family protein
MVTFRSILFPVDFSPACVAMAPFVKRASALFSASVTLLYVMEPPASSFELYVRPLPEVEANREQVARANLNAFLESEFPAESTHRILQSGDVASHIAEVARERNFDSIIMPTHAGGFRRMLLGSTTAKILDRADCPVMTTQHAETMHPRPLEHRELLCAIGLQADSERVLRYVTQVLEPVYSQLTIIHAIPAGEPGLAVQLDLDERVEQAEREAARRRIEKLQRAVGSHARVKIAVGPVKDALAEAAWRLRADVLVIGRSPHAGAFGRLRDLVYVLVRDAPCPVLSV